MKKFNSQITSVSNGRLTSTCRHWEHLDLINAYKLFLSPPLILSSDKSIGLEFFVVFCVVPVPEGRKLERLSAERALEVLEWSLLRRCPYRKMGRFWPGINCEITKGRRSLHVEDKRCILRRKTNSVNTTGHSLILLDLWATKSNYRAWRE